jgi:hypothetical protein
MMRVICLLLVSLFALKVNAQQYTKFNGYGFQADRIKSDSISIHPSDTIRNKAARSIAVLNGVFYIADGTKWKVVGTDTTALSNRINLKLNIADTSSMLSNYSRLKSVGLTMPSAFSVANSPLTSNGTLAVTGAGTSSQYVRGDGQLANFPSNGGGGSSVNYYLNGSVNQGTFGGDTYYEMNKTPILGAGTNFTRTNGQGNGYIASFITDAGDPSLLNIPAGNWNLEFYFQSSASGGSPEFYGEIYKVSSSNVFTLVASGSANPEGITNGTTVDQYFTSISVPQTSLLLTDRLAIRIYVITSGRTITLHTENSNLCEVLTTFSTGLNALNGLTNQVQYFATGTSGTDFAISSATDTHTFNLPTASATNRGALSTTDWSTFNSKIGAGDTATMLTPYSRGSGTSGQVAYWNATRSLTGSSGFTFTPTTSLLLNNSVTAASAIARGQNITSTLTAAANSDVLVGLDVNPTFTNGAFTGVQNHAARIQGNTVIGATTYSTMLYGEIPKLFVNGGTKLNATVLLGTSNIQFSGNNVSWEATGITNNLPEWRADATGIKFGNYLSLPLRISVNGTENARFFSTGNVAIGTTTDAGYKLDVNGTARFSDNLFSDKFLLIGTSANAWGSFTSALQIGGSSTYASLNNITYIGNNTFFSAAWKYQNTAPSARIEIQDGFKFFIAPSGTAGTNITYTQPMTINSSGNVLIGTTTNAASSKLTVESTTQGFLPPRMTTAQRDLISSPAAGLIIYNTSTNKHQGYNGTTWNDFY